MLSMIKSIEDKEIRPAYARASFGVEIGYAEHANNEVAELQPGLRPKRLFPSFCAFSCMSSP